MRKNQSLPPSPACVAPPAADFKVVTDSTDLSVKEGSRSQARVVGGKRERLHDP